MSDTPLLDNFFSSRRVFEYFLGKNGLECVKTSKIMKISLSNKRNLWQKCPDIRPCSVILCVNCSNRATQDKMLLIFAFFNVFCQILPILMPKWKNMASAFLSRVIYALFSLIFAYYDSKLYEQGDFLLFLLSVFCGFLGVFQ